MNKTEHIDYILKNNLSVEGIKLSQIYGVVRYLLLDYAQSYDKAMSLSGYPQKRELAITSEHEREIQVFQKVLNKTRNIDRKTVQRN